MDATVITDIFGSYSPIAPMIVLIIGALIMPALYFGFKKKAPVTAIALIVMVISIAINLIMLTGGNYPAEYSSFEGLFEYNDFSGLMILLFQAVSIIVLFVSVSSTETTTLHYGAYNSLLLIATVGMMFVGAADRPGRSIFVGVEAVSPSPPTPSWP
jgi:NADH-quinone oxidoreductase subunit N